MAVSARPEWIDAGGYAVAQTGRSNACSRCHPTFGDRAREAGVRRQFEQEEAWCECCLESDGQDH